MSRRRVQIVILCEDRQTAAFARRFAEAKGWEKRQIEVILSPKGRGSGEQWVRERYANEVRKLRAAPYVARGLVVVMDEDTQSTEPRDVQLTNALKKQGVTIRSANEPILHIIPCRNIETWLAYLGGETVDECAIYPKLARERDCVPMVNTLKSMCDAGKLREPAPSSLERACVEYCERLPTS